MLEKELWEKFHKEGYNRFSLSRWHLWKLFRQYKDILRRSEAVLDVGCGGGYSLNYLKKYCNRNFLSRLINHRKFAKAYGIEISEIDIEKARKQYPNIEFRVCDGQSIPFEDNFFDFIFMSSVTVHIPRRFTKNYIKEFYRVLRPGGFALIQLVSFPQIDDIEENPIPYPDFGPEPHIGWPIQKILELVLGSKLTLWSIFHRIPKVDNPAIKDIRDYWVLLKKEK